MADRHCTAWTTQGGRVTVSTGGANSNRLLTPEEADRLAEDIRLAARNARQITDSKWAPALGVVA